MNEENNVLTIKTVQIQPIRNMITAIKDILTDATITFTKDGLKIINFDKTHTILVNVNLKSRQFEKYDCHPDKIIVCANTLHFFKVISTMSNDDTLSMYIEKGDYHDGIVSFLGLQYDNGDIRQCYSQKLRLIEPDMEELVVPDVEYSTVINLPTSDFQKIIRDLNGISDRIEIKSVGNDLIFSCDGPFASSRIFRSESDGYMNFIQKSDASVVIQGEFSLKSLSHFIKCTPLCSHLEMYLGNDLPLIVKYDVASLGEIKLCLAPLPPS
jgi:proliferating cell nuclear antigen|uniref:Proliferating cell nuclear antigen PCNA N-terminal domain-containing protein n=1 Tax=viral metagenome TaxID=1070528 RepID=A0A6C0ING6_9ZZZZ